MGALKSTIPFGLHPSSLESLKQPASNKQNKQNSTHSTHTTRPVRWCLAYPWCRLKKSALVFWDGVRPRSRITAITADHPQIIVHFSAQPHFICVIQTITSHLTYPVHNQILFLTDELCLTTTFRRNPPFTWCSVFVEVWRERLKERQRETEAERGRERQRAGASVIKEWACWEVLYLLRTHHPLQEWHHSGQMRSTWLWVLQLGVREAGRACCKLQPCWWTASCCEVVNEWQRGKVEVVLGFEIVQEICGVNRGVNRSSRVS